MEIFYGRETAKALKLWGEGQTPRELIRAYGEVKLAALRGQQKFAKLYGPEFFALLEHSCNEIISGTHDIQFPLPLAQGGAGTSLHMNICEVIANLGNRKAESAGLAERCDALDHIARFQSTNDTLATAFTILSYRGLQSVTAAVVQLQEALNQKELAWEQILLMGRTELQDALPIQFGQVFGAWAGMFERDRWRLHKVAERIRNIALGGTAIGTSFAAPPRYIFAAEQELRKITGLPLSRSQNLPDAVAHKDDLAELVSAYGLTALNLRKLCGDLLLYTSSLNGELSHPELQYGSSIMPSKVNPVLLEYASGLGVSVETEARRLQSYAAMGQLQLNAYIPFMIEAMLRCQGALTAALRSLARDLLPELKLNGARIEANLSRSPALLNTLRHVVDYSQLKALLPELRTQNPNDREELAQWLAQRLERGGQKLQADEILRHFDGIEFH